MPRPQTVADDELFDRLAGVFRSAGYAGASLGALAEASGLQRASLYHRFPGGKAEMAQAVLRRATELFGWATEPMYTESDPATGIREAAGRINQLYADGSMSCVANAVTLSGAPDPVLAGAREMSRVWVEGMEAVALRAGRDAESARSAAQDAFVRIEGALVYARVFGDSAPYERSLDELVDLLLP
jgi:AcrR family transcriptional regulator